MLSLLNMYLTRISSVLNSVVITLYVLVLNSQIFAQLNKYACWTYSIFSATYFSLLENQRKLGVAWFDIILTHPNQTHANRVGHLCCFYFLSKHIKLPKYKIFQKENFPNIKYSCKKTSQMYNLQYPNIKTSLIYTIPILKLQ